MPIFIEDQYAPERRKRADADILTDVIEIARTCDSDALRAIGFANIVELLKCEGLIVSDAQRMMKRFRALRPGVKL